MQPIVRRFAFVIAVALFAGSLFAQGGLPDGPSWGRGSFQPDAKNTLFASGDGCALCHSVSENASALRNVMGDDVSPHGLWQATMMANAFRDPYFRAQLAREVEAHPDNAAAIEGLCLKCHAPMAHHTKRIASGETLRLADVKDDGLAKDGVSCTLCHQIQPDGLGKPETFSGNPLIKPGRQIFGPYENPIPGPMRMHSAFTPTHGAHTKQSALCGSCHTLSTQHAPNAAPFLEQSPYLEWKNSVFTDEGTPTEESRTCQDCHMPSQGTMRIARNPRGLDFNMAARPNVPAHVLLGGNAYMLELLKKNREAFGVIATDRSLERAVLATRRLLSQETATIEVRHMEKKDGFVTFDVHVRNETGHKFPAGYPSRRAWLMVDARAGSNEFFTSGGFNEKGMIVGPADERGEPHRNLITQPKEVAIYEMVAVDASGKSTTMLSEMAKPVKDNRLLPRGWKKDGPHAQDTAPVGLGDDPDFAGGEDVVHYKIALPKDADGRITVIVRLLYQTIPPAWLEPFRASNTPEAKSFLTAADKDKPLPEQIAVTVETAD